MNRIIFSLVMCFMALTNPILAADNLTISNFMVVQGVGGQEFTINLNNGQTYAAFQFDLYLPKGITITSISAEQRLPEANALTYSEQEDGSYRFIYADISKGNINDIRNISGTSGSIIKITVSASSNVATGSLTGDFRNIKLSDKSGEGNTYNEMSFPVTVLKLGDVNDDGDVDIADAVCIVNHIVGKPNATFIEAAADVNGDGDIDIADAVHIVNYVVGKINALAPKFDITLREPQ